ncbi:MAG: DUF2326 domain-containing protein, partial [Candidatus Electrothrix sp. AR3]|nr:DUF2326 domain-containing protein [Candidatus Electrothrix sp. AR3]
MFLKSLIIRHGDGTIIRDISFHLGLNLIVDETSVGNGKETGNNVGKTTVLKLIDFCLGGNEKEIYTDPENTRNIYKLVKDFLVDNKIYISLILKEDLLQEDSQEILIERNFLRRNNKIQYINNKKKTDDEFEEELTNILFPGHYGNKPTFRQIISHNIRYKDFSINNTLRTLNRYTRTDEYEALYLFLFGCDFEQGVSKQRIRSKIETEEKFKKRLESDQTKSAYEAALALLELEIIELENRKTSLNLNPDFESALDRLNKVKYQINITSSEIGRLELRKELILEAQDEIQARSSNIDISQLKQIYQQATSLVVEIQKTFQELYEFHNQMLESKIQFITQDLPRIERELSEERKKISDLLSKKKELAATIVQSDSFDLLEKLVMELNLRYQK